MVSLYETLQSEIVEMKTTSQNTILAGIGAILVLALVGMPLQTAEAEMDSTSVLYKLQSIQNEITSLQENTQNFNINKLGIQVFDFRLVGNDLLEIQASQNLASQEGKELSLVIDVLIADYTETLEQFQSQVKTYEKDNGLATKQKQLFNEIVKNYADFKITDERIQEEIDQNDFVQSELQRLDAEEKFQKLINKVAIEQADASNGNLMLQKNFHEIVLNKIVDNENWGLVSPSLDRVINQFTNPEIKQRLIEFKVQVVNSIKQLEYQENAKPRVLALTSESGETVFQFGILDLENVINTPSILASQLKNEIKSIIGESQKIIEDEKQKIEEYVELQREQSRIDDEEDAKDRKLALLSVSEPEPVVESVAEPGNSGGNANENGSENANENALSNPQSNGNGNGKGDEKGKGKGTESQ